MITFKTIKWKNFLSTGDHWNEINFLQENENKEMVVVEIDDDLALKTCKAHNYKYAVITRDDIIIPPKK